MWLALLPLALAATLTPGEVMALGLSDSPAAQALLAEREQSRANANANVPGTASAELERLGAETEARLSVPLPVATAPRARAAVAAGDAADAAYLDARAALADQLWGAYVGLALAEELEQIAARNAALNARLAEGAARRLDAGEISATEATLARALAAREGVEALGAAQERVRAAAELGALLGLAPDPTLRSAGFPTFTLPEPPEGEHPRVEGARASADAAARNARATAAGSLSPAATLGALSGEEGPGWIVGATVQIPLGAPAQVRAARAAAALAVARADGALAEVRAARAIAEARLQAAEAAYQLAEVPGLDEAPAALLAAFEAGELSIGEYAAQQQLLTEALIARAGARAELELARVGVWTALGLVPEIP